MNAPCPKPEHDKPRIQQNTQIVEKHHDFNICIEKKPEQTICVKRFVHVYKTRPMKKIHPNTQNTEKAMIK